MSSIEEFVEYAAKLKGNEKSEAQVFLEHLFQAFGHKSLAEIGGILEDRVKKKEGKGKKFADLVWPGKVLIEMKSRGQRLERHYRQVFDYWCQIVPHRPRWVILCNFDEFWIYDFDIQVDEPLDKVLLVDLPHRLSSFSFLKPTCEEPVFGLNRVEVTKASADLIARVFNSMVARDIPREQAQRFILQSVVCLFSEDLNLLPEDFFSRLIDECMNSRNPSTESFEKFGGLFRQMNDPKAATGGRFKGVRYFNGGLFSVVDPVELTKDELTDLFAAAKQNWTQVNPAIFGTLFQHSMGKEAQHAFGAHYTSEADIMKVVNPTIVRPWRDRLENTKTRKDLIALWDELRSYRVLDPACGSGNFLYVAFRELKRIETELIVKMRTNFPSMQQFTQGYLSAKQFYGFDVLPFAVELTKVTLLLAKELGIVEANKAIDANDGISWLDLDPALPLDNLDDNIKNEDALFNEWPKVDAIIGNPPYLDARKFTIEHGRKYVNQVRRKYKVVPGRADMCVYWFRRSHDELGENGRAGLVGTNSIRQNYSREGGLDYIVNNGGTIYEAVSSQVWSGDAVVHVSIVNWKKGKEPGDKLLYTQLGDSVSSPWKVEKLENIPATLSSDTDVTSAKELEACIRPKCCYEGQQPGSKGFIIDKDTLIRIKEKDKTASEVVFPYMGGEDLLIRSYISKSRYIIDFGEMDMFSAMKHREAFKIVEECVLPQWKIDAEKESIESEKNTGEHQNRLKNWWILKRRRSELLEKISSLPRFIACSATTKRQIFEFISSSYRPSNSMKIFPFCDDYSFGIIQSTAFWLWITAKGSSLKRDSRFTPEVSVKTFPWPQKPVEEAIALVAKNAVKLRYIRNEVMQKNDWGLRKLYEASEKIGSNPLNEAQKELDMSVMASYRMNTGEDILSFLLQLNLDCAEREASGEVIMGPGLPSWINDKNSYVTEDCVRLL